MAATESRAAASSRRASRAFSASTKDTNLKRLTSFILRNVSNNVSS